MRITRAVATRTQAVSELFNLGDEDNRFRRELPPITDPIDRSALVVGEEHRAVRSEEQIDGTPPRLLSLQPAFGEDLVSRRPSVLERHEHHAVPDLVSPVPGAVLGDEDPFP